MTAEIAILNKHGIALAADSAVTIGNGQKVFTSVNKIICLSGDHSVAVMIYGNASFLGVPWEIIIDAFEKKIEDKPFNKVTDYAQNFTDFLKDCTELFPTELQENEYKKMATSFLGSVRITFEREVRLLFEKQKEVDEKEIADSLKKIIEDEHGKWFKKDYIKSVDTKIHKLLVKKYTTQLNIAIKNTFGTVKLSNLSKRKLVDTLLFIPTKKFFSDRHSGVVFAGFGSNEFFPSLSDITIETLFGGFLKYDIDISKVEHDNNASIVPFAQKDMVQQFMEGIHPELRKQIDMELKRVFAALPRLAINEVSGISEAQKKEYAEIFKKQSESIVSYIDSQIAKFQNANYIREVINMVAVLPTEELAMMAESLVSLTSFKRRISRGAETVGGPIDVIVITKAKGPVWVKRKQIVDLIINAGKVIK